MIVWSKWSSRLMLTSAKHKNPIGHIFREFWENVRMVRFWHAQLPKSDICLGSHPFSVQQVHHSQPSWLLTSWYKSWTLTLIYKVSSYEEKRDTATFCTRKKDWRKAGFELAMAFIKELRAHKVEYSFLVFWKHCSFVKYIFLKSLWRDGLRCETWK